MVNMFCDWLATAPRDQIIAHVREKLQAIRECVNSVDDGGDFDDPDFREEIDGALWIIFEAAPEMWDCFYKLRECANDFGPRAEIVRLMR